MSNQTFKAKDEVIDSQYGWGVVQSGNDTEGYEVGFGDILAPDEFPVHVLHRAAGELKPADQPKPEDDSECALENLRMSYHDERAKAQEIGASYLDYKDWLEERLLKQIKFTAELQGQVLRLKGVVENRELIIKNHWKAYARELKRCSHLRIAALDVYDTCFEKDDQKQVRHLRRVLKVLGSKPYRSPNGE